jgi:CheY-like chemotaxis protein
LRAVVETTAWIFSLGLARLREERTRRGEFLIEDSQAAFANKPCDSRVSGGTPRRHPVRSSCATFRPPLNRIRLLSSAPIISIVDDDDSVRAAMSSLVRSLGYKSCVFWSAQEFLTSPRLHDASCLITDVQMPGMSGLELQDELAVRRPDMPVILITAFPEERIRKRAEAAGAVAFFSKPVDGHALIECLNAALRSS